MNNSYRLVPERHDSDHKNEIREVLDLERKYKNWRGKTFRFYDNASDFRDFMRKHGVQTWLYPFKTDNGQLEQVLIDDRDKLKALRALDSWVKNE